MKPIKVFPIIFVMAAILVGCSNTPTIVPLNTPPSQSVTQDVISLVPTPTNTTTPIPTASNSESEILVNELLEDNGKCQLPCVWGITPGETTYSEAQEFFKHLGWKGNENAYYETGKDLESSSLNLRVGVYAPNNAIEKIHVGIGGNDYINRVKYLSFENILKVLGKPSEIFVFVGTKPGVLEPVETSFEFLLYYESENTLIEYAGTAVRTGNFYRFCPANPNLSSAQVNPTSGYVSLYVGYRNHVSTPENLVRPFWLLPKYYISAEKSLGMSIDKIYETALQNTGNACFDSPLSAWQRK